MKANRSALAAIALALVTGCNEEATVDTAPSPAPAHETVTYSRGAPIEVEQPEITGFYTGTISSEGPGDVLDERPLIVSVYGGDVRVWINSEVYPTFTTTATDTSVTATLRLAGDEPMVLNGKYSDDTISGTVERASGYRGKFAVRRL